jgi:hypothetical protein
MSIPPASSRIVVCRAGRLSGSGNILIHSSFTEPRNDPSPSNTPTRATCPGAAPAAERNAPRFSNTSRTCSGPSLGSVPVDGSEPMIPEEHTSGPTRDPKGMGLLPCPRPSTSTERLELIGSTTPASRPHLIATDESIPNTPVMTDSFALSLLVHPVKPSVHPRHDADEGRIFHYSPLRVGKPLAVRQWESSEAAGFGQQPRRSEPSLTLLSWAPPGSIVCKTSLRDRRPTLLRVRVACKRRT